MTNKTHCLLSLAMALPPCTAMTQEPAPAEQPAMEAPAPAATLTGEQQDIAHMLMDGYLNVVSAAKEVTLSITDKETATAAAPKLDSLLQQMDEFCDALENWAAEEGITDAVDALLVESYKDKAAVLSELDKALTDLADMEVPFYGSNELEAVFSEAEEEAPDTTTPAPEAFEDEAPELQQEVTTDAFEGGNIPSPEVLMDCELQLYKDIKEVLQSVNDKDSANAAAAKFKAMVDEIVNIESMLAPLTGQPDFEVVNSQYLKEVDTLQTEISALIKQLQELEVPFYGSNDMETLFRH